MKKRIRFIHLLILTLCLPVLGLLTACNDFNEDLPECRLYVKFKYDYNIKSVDAFHKQVDKVELFVFDKNGKFLFRQSEEGAALATGYYLMTVNLPVGEYKFMAWVGAHDSYAITQQTRGESDLEEMELKLIREPSLIIDKELEPLWYGEIIDVNFTGKTHQTETINLIKNTNKLRFVFQGRTDSWTMNVNNYSYEIIDANGYNNYTNDILPDDVLSYQPYVIQQMNPSAGVVEINTMRLMANRVTRLVVTEKATRKKMFDMNLTDFLIMLRLDEYSHWSNQEYLDREDEYKVVFFFSEEQPSDRPWLLMTIDINGWTWRFQTEGEI